MSVPMLKNFIGIKLSDEDMGKIPYPKLELMMHVTYKTVQAGSLLAGAFMAPGFHLYNYFKGNVKYSLARRMARYGSRGFIFGIPLGPLLTLTVTFKDPPEKNFDRCYRLRHNQHQLNIDRVTTVTGIVGQIGSRAIGLLPLEGASVGVILGVVCGNIVNKLL